MRLRPWIFRLAHVATAVVILRVSELAAVHHGILSGIGLGLLTGVLMQSLYFSLLRDQMNGNGALVTRALRRGGLVGTAIACIIWFYFAGPPLMNGFKYAWLLGAILAARALAGPSSYRSRSF
jgi:hypothetical protein